VEVTFLGTGTSMGVPMIGCACAVCQSTDPRDNRSRPSILVRLASGAAILVDTSSDLRAQALRFKLTRNDAVLYTHSHADHILGLDEMRRFNTLQGTPIPCYANACACDILKKTFYYAFDGLPREGGGVPQLGDIEVAGPFTVGGAEVLPVPVTHGVRTILGFRFGRFAYLTDCCAIPDASWPLLEGLDVVVGRAASGRTPRISRSTRRWRRRRGSAPAARSSPTWRTISATPPRAPGCPRGWRWRMTA
jgi:phosphoribosyl 1,2-cyclic phosphate phosphodiesterase